MPESIPAPRIIGYLTRGLEPSDTYSRKLWAAVEAEARERGATLLMISAQVLEDPNPMDRAHAAILRLVGPDLIDGALLSNTLTYLLEPERLERFEREWRGVPTVTMSAALRGRPEVRVENARGMRALMRHLIETHGCRRIIHVRGPYPNAEAALREDAWRSELVAAGIEPQPEWLIPGSFDNEGLETIGRDIFDRAGTEFDAVVACNDRAALRVIEDFQAMGCRVPEDYIVCGFDDIESGQHSSPSLTTVRQHVDVMIGLAWDRLDLLLEGNMPEDAGAPATLVVRASCGCPRRRWGPDPFPALSRLPRASGEVMRLITRYETEKDEFQRTVYALHTFIREMTRVTETERLPPVLHEWLPRFGISRFLVLQCSDRLGQVVEHTCRWEPGQLLPDGPSYLSVLTGFPSPPTEVCVLDGGRFALPDWFVPSEPAVLGMFPLVVGDVWHGLAVFELTGQAGLIELALQEQLSSTFDRIATEKRLRQTAALRSFVGEAAHQINTPLGALVSAHGIIQARLSVVADDWLEFVHTLSKNGRALFVRLYSDLWKASRLPLKPAAARAKIKHWSAVLNGLATEPERLAEELARVGFQGSDEQLREYAADPDFARVIGSAARLSDLPNSIAIVGSAAEKIGSYVNQLWKSLR